MTLESSRLTLLPCSPEQILSLIEQPERFEGATGFPAADGLREFFVSGDVSPGWLASLRAASGPDPWRFGFFVIERERRSVIASTHVLLKCGFRHAGEVIDPEDGPVWRWERGHVADRG